MRDHFISEFLILVFIQDKNPLSRRKTRFSVFFFFIFACNLQSCSCTGSVADERIQNGFEMINGDFVIDEDTTVLYLYAAIIYVLLRLGTW